MLAIAATRNLFIAAPAVMTRRTVDYCNAYFYCSAWRSLVLRGSLKLVNWWCFRYFLLSLAASCVSTATSENIAVLRCDLCVAKGYCATVRFHSACRRRPSRPQTHFAVYRRVDHYAHRRLAVRQLLWFPAWTTTPGRRSCRCGPLQIIPDYIASIACAVVVDRDFYPTLLATYHYYR